jgi:hypothetical protein
MLCAGSGCATWIPEEPEIVRFHGPLPNRSMMPLSLIFGQPLPDKPGRIDAGKNEVNWVTHYSSILVKELKGQEQMNVDGEFLRTSLWMKRGLSDRIEVGLELPFVHYTGGFLDKTIEDFHDLFGFPQGKRDSNPNNQYEVTYRNAEGLFFTAEENGFHLSDIPLYLKVGILEPEESGVALAARGTLKLPTGDEDDGHGSGKFDGGFGVLLQKDLTRSLACYLNVDHIFRKSPDSFRGVSASNVTHGTLSFEKAFTSAFSLILQTDYQTRPLESVDLSVFRYPEWTGSVGVGYHFSERFRMGLTFTEGITTDTAPDFVVGMNLALQF